MLRAVSVNLWNGKADPDALEALLRRLDPDVVGAQELSPDQAEAIGRVLPYGLLEPDTKHLGMGIALRRPAEIERVPMTYRDLRVAHLDPASWPDLSAPIEFATVHIAAPHVRPYGIGPWIRRRQVQQLDTHLRANPDRRRILMGDFNATPLWPVHRRVSARLTDAAVAVAQVHGRPVERTWGPGASAPRMLRIDHAFVRGLRPVEFQVLDLPGSDHSAIVADFALE